MRGPYPFIVHFLKVLTNTPYNERETLLFDIAIYHGSSHVPPYYTLLLRSIDFGYTIGDYIIIFDYNVLYKLVSPKPLYKPLKKPSQNPIY